MLPSQSTDLPTYKGLSNIGATCYMNSLLQTLYMTPEFREAIYQWKYNQKVHPKPEDSILYQLQKLFGKLDRKFPAEVTTRDLVKSFQWHDQEAQMQQDIQEFNRVLFEALEKSLKSKKQAEQSTSHFVRDLYEGEMVHYTHCKQCENQSQKQQYFQDLMLTVKNPFEKIYNKCIDLGLQRYMKPEILDQNNLYKCEACQKMVQAQRGVRFLKLPKLLTIILRRFDFDYFTFQRVKVNDRVEFPHVLNMNNYMQGYANIQNKHNEDQSAYFLDKEIPYENKNHKPPTFSTTGQRKVVTKKSGTPNVAGKITTKPSANTKSFLSEMRKKKIQSQEMSEDLLFVSGNAEMHKKEVVENGDTQLKVNMEVKSAKLPHKDKKQEVQETIQTLSAQLSKKQNTEPVKTIAKQEKMQQDTTLPEQIPSLEGLSLPPPPPLLMDLNLTPPAIAEPYRKVQISAGMSVQQQLAQKMLQRQKQAAQKQQKLRQLHQKNQSLIQEYLKQGSLVYELYAVMVHNGSANHGHYFSYIRSFEDQHWYCFNDDRVSRINVEEIEKTFGGLGGHSNAYALYYRQVGGGQEAVRSFTVPSYIENCLEEEIAHLKRRQKQKIQNLQNVLVLKIYYQLSVKLLQINKSSSLELCHLKARQMFDIPEAISISNTRLRMFNPVSQTKLETFGGKEHMSLEQLKILSYKSMLLEVKKDEEFFEEFVLGKINLRVAFWQQCQNNLKSLDQSHLTLHKISVFKGSQIKDVQTTILQKRKQLNLSTLTLSLPISQQQQICIIKRHQNDEYSYHEILNLGECKEKNIDELMVMENQVLFVELNAEEKLNWPEEFQNQIYRITIKYVDGNTGKVQGYLTDSRKTVGELKESLYPSDTIIKRGNRSGMELKNLAASMKDTRFISGTQVYLQKGLPAKPGQIRIQLFIATDASDDCYNRLHQFQFIADVPINGQCKAAEIKQIFSTVLKKYKGIELTPEKFRIREKVCDKIGKIYRERPMKQQQLIEKREIAIEEKTGTIDDKEFLVYVRVWNPQTWTLSKKLQIIVSKTTTMKDLAILIHTQNQQVPIQQMQICRILSINKFNILDLCQMEYFQMTDASVIAEPLFVNADGLMFVIKSAKKEPRALTKEEQGKFGGNIKPYSKTTRGRANPGPSKKQKGVTIKVVQNNDQQEKQQKTLPPLQTQQK